MYSIENGERVQVAISMTLPSKPVGTDVKPVSTGGLDFASMGTPVAEASAFKPAEITEEEKETVRDLMARLGL